MVDAARRLIRNTLYEISETMPIPSPFPTLERFLMALPLDLKQIGNSFFVSGLRPGPLISRASAGYTTSPGRRASPSRDLVSSPARRASTNLGNQTSTPTLSFCIGSL